jgi:hypothetical protein
MKQLLAPVFLGVAVLAVSGCATYNRHGLDAQQAREMEGAYTGHKDTLSADLKARIMALDPERLTESQIRDVLSQAPAPRIINIHGGIFPVHTRMISFSKFLVGMGYPEFSLTNGADGTYTFSCYESSAKVAGMIAWYYEKEGLRPIIVGHSQGGFQAVKVLYQFAGRTVDRLEVWNPLTWQPEGRFEIIDPLTGKERAVVGLQLPYVTAVGSGGLTRFLPNQWSVCGRLRTIPDSVEEFTGFYKGMDLLGGDYLGYGSANYSKPNGHAIVRTVCLPFHYHHGAIPDTKHLLASQEMKDWINNYQPGPGPVETPKLDQEFDADSRHILWAADVWHSIKRHWVLELQRMIRAQSTRQHGS